MTAIAPDREVQVLLALSVYEDGKPQSIEMNWEPVGRPPDARVTSSCEPPWHAGYATNVNQDYGSEKRVEISDPELLDRMADGNALRPGTYDEPNASTDGRWRLTVTKVTGKGADR